MNSLSPFINAESEFYSTTDSYSLSSTPTSERKRGERELSKLSINMSRIEDQKKKKKLVGRRNLDREMTWETTPYVNQ